jgi:hypothetical protein
VNGTCVCDELIGSVPGFVYDQKTDGGTVCGARRWWDCVRSKQILKNTKLKCGKEMTVRSSLRKRWSVVASEGEGEWEWRRRPEKTLKTSQESLFNVLNNKIKLNYI